MSTTTFISQAKELIQSVWGTPLSRTQRVTLSIELAALMQKEASQIQTGKEKAQQAQLSRMMLDPKGKAFTTSMTDQCFRSHTKARVANQLVYLLHQFGVPKYLSASKQFQLSAFLRLGQALSTVLVPLAAEALRKETASVILPGEKEALSGHMKLRRKQGVRLNLNYLGEAILSEAEAKRRLDVYLDALSREDVEYVSVKISTLYSQIHLVGWEGTLSILKDRLRQLYRVCLQHQFVRADGEKVPKFLNLDMEEYRDLHLTKTLFQQVLDEPEFFTLSAGIVLQAYLPDSFLLQTELTSWALERVKKGGAPVKIRLVKGANLAMEQFEASVRGWSQAPYRQKIEVDANFKRMVEYGLQKEHAHAVLVGIGSHNLFDIAYAMLLRSEQRIEAQVSFEMLEGMADPMRRVVQTLTGSMLLYCPAATKEDFQSAVAYLVRRLDENTGPDNFLRHTFGLLPGTDVWDDQVLRFQQACQKIDSISDQPARKQNRLLPEKTRNNHRFENEPDTDFSLPANRMWADQIFSDFPSRSIAPIPLVVGGREILLGLSQGQGIDPSRPSASLYKYALATSDEVELALSIAKDNEASFAGMTLKQRADLLFAVGDKMRLARAELCGVMMLDSGKTLLEADPEVSEAIDFADYYARNLLDLGSEAGVKWKPKGTVLITPPWNFPISIPAGGILAALAAGNCVVFKPAPEAVLCGFVLANLFWDAGVPKNVLQFINCVDDPVGTQLISDPRLNAIILTGATSTALFFKKQNPFVDLYAETGGKNAMIITAMSDRDLAIKDLVQSAFGHAGQKCSAASLAILEAEVYDDPHFLNQLKEAVLSVKVGLAFDKQTKINPMIRPPSGALLKGLTTLEEGEEWLVTPRPDANNPHLWSPGVKLGVKPGSFMHQTELFGPVLGVMRAADLDQAIDFANGTPYGLTSGLQSLDEREQDHFVRKIQAGNCYINRTITGAIVERQPFGGIKGSSFGTGAKAGGPFYLAQLMHAEPDVMDVSHLPEPNTFSCLAPLKDAAGLQDQDTKEFHSSLRSYAFWAKELCLPKDPAKIVGQDNFFRHKPVSNMVFRIGPKDDARSILQVFAAAISVGCRLEVSYLPGETPAFLTQDKMKDLSPLWFTPESLLDFEARVRKGAFGRVRLISNPREALQRAAAESGTTLIHSKVLSQGRFELLSYLFEVSVSIDYHRYGSLGVRENEARSPILGRDIF